MAAIEDLPADRQQARIKASTEQRGDPTRRLLLGRDTDGSVQLAMKICRGARGW